MDVSVSDILPSEPPTPPTRTSENLRANIQSLNVHLDALKAQSLEQKRNLEIEKATLQETANRLNLQVHSAKGEIKRAAENERVVSKRSADTEGVCSHRSRRHSNNSRVDRSLNKPRRPLPILRTI
jgi:hypothetical protein